ncbi:MAG: histidine--tRNA ligase [Nitriliruptorales bacterium]|nr:histidine--tRNA ligase [Nitriliruptorales bacterium]
MPPHPRRRSATAVASYERGRTRDQRLKGHSVTASVNIGPISGFPEWLPEVRILEQTLIDRIRRAYELFGFAPIETPAAERLEVLTSKGGMERQMYSLGRPAEDGADAVTSLGLHFDLTVPLARYVASHAEELVFPFRRYQIQKVWRGERAQRGRFREFYQCDVDIVGDGSLAVAYDAEMPCVINSAFGAIGVGEFRVHVSNRKILSGLFGAFGIEGEQVAEALRLVDKYGMSDRPRLAAALQEHGCEPKLVDRVLDVLPAGTVEEAMGLLEGFDAAREGATELRDVLDRAVQLGMPAERLVADFSIARGLDYYTGTVYETFVAGNQDWGSVCSGGRYDDLTLALSGRAYPGVGISIGLTRLLYLLIQSRTLQPGARTPAVVLVTMQDAERYFDDYLALGHRLRGSGIPTEVYMQPDALRDQITYAVRKGFPLALIAGSREFDDSAVTLRDLRERSQETVRISDLIPSVTERVGPPGTFLKRARHG